MKIAAETYINTIGTLSFPGESDLSGKELETATEKQKETISRFGVATNHIVYKGQASLVLDMIFARSKRGLCSPKQVEILLRNGYTKAEIVPMTRKKATDIIAEIFKIEEPAAE